MSEVNNAPAPDAVEFSEIPAEESNTAVSESQPQQKGNALEPDYDGVEAESNDSDSVEEAIKEAKKEEARRKKLKLKVNGKELEQEIDFDDDDYLKEMLQKAMSSDEKFQEAAQIKKQMEQIARMLQEDPVSLLKEVGYDFDEMAEKHLQQRVEELQKSPEQLEKEKFQRELEQERKLRKELEQKQFEAEQARIQEEYARNLNDEITEALESTTLKKTPGVVKRIADVMMVGLERGKDLSPKDVLPFVERQIRQEIQELLEASPDDALDALLGTKTYDRLRKRNLSKAKKAVQTSSQVKPTGQTEMNKAAVKNEPSKPVNAKDFFKNL